MNATTPPRRHARLSLVMILPMLVTGFVAVTLVQTQNRRPAFRSEYSSIESVLLTESALRLQQEQVDLKNELAALRAELDTIQEQAARTSTAAGALQQQIDALKADAGLTQQSGAGVIVTLDDARVPPTRDQRSVAPAIIHSQDITDVFNAAWGAGATAIAVNGERITGSSACVGATIQINGTLMSPPFVISILGPPDRLSQQLNDPRVLADLRARERVFGLRFDVASADDLAMPAYTGPLGIRYATVR